MAYAELDITTHFTFLTGASHSAELIERAKALGLTTVGVADRNTLSGIVRAYSAAKDAGVDFRVGTRLVTTDGSELLAYPKTCAAYAKLTRLLTLGNRRADRGVCQLDLSDILAGLADTVLILEQPMRSQAHIPALQETFGDDLYLGLAPHYDGWDEDRFQIVSDLADHHTLPLVALGNVLMHASRRRMLAGVLSAIRLKCTVDELGQHAQLNAERRLRSEFEIRRLSDRVSRAEAVPAAHASAHLL